MSNVKSTAIYKTPLTKAYWADAAAELKDTKMLVLTALMMHAMPCGMNTIVFPKLVGQDCRTGAGRAPWLLPPGAAFPGRWPHDPDKS